MSDEFHFKTEARISPKRFEAILPAWQKLLEEIGFTLDTDDTTEINRLAVSESYENELVSLLDKELVKIKDLSRAEQVSYVMSHQPLRLALKRAEAIVADRSTQD